jgi:hypothetical protein
MSDRSDRDRKRYAEDPEYRERKLAAGKAYKKRNKLKLSAKRRLRRATDPEFRERCNACNRGYQERNKPRLNAERRLRWATDPDYRERHNQSNRAAVMKRLYGITIEEYDALLAKQKGRCAICKETPKRERLSVDHCHRGKFVRWLLCGLCNRGIGCFRDDPRLLRTAADALSRIREPKPRPPTKPARKKRR